MSEWREARRGWYVGSTRDMDNGEGMLSGGVLLYAREDHEGLGLWKTES